MSLPDGAASALEIAGAVASRRVSARAVAAAALDRIGKRDVSNQPFAEKCRYTMARTIHKLIRDHEVHRLVFFFERAHGGDGDNSFHSELLHAIDIGAKV